MPPRKTIKKMQYSARLPPHVVDVLKTTAARERRTPSQLLAVLVEEALATRVAKAVKNERMLLPTEGVMG